MRSARWRRRGAGSSSVWAVAPSPRVAHAVHVDVDQVPQLSDEEAPRAPPPRRRRPAGTRASAGQPARPATVVVRPSARQDLTVPLPGRAADVEFLGLRLHPDTPCVTLAVVERLCAPFGFLYGGTGLAACVAAAEAVTGRPLVWITTQYVANAVPGEQVDLAVEVVAEGRATSQTHVRGSVGERNGAPRHHGAHRPTDRPGTAWGGPPTVSAADDCPPLDVSWAPSGRSFFDELDRRIPPENEALVERRPGRPVVPDPELADRHAGVAGLRRRHRADGGVLGARPAARWHEPGQHRAHRRRRGQ